MTYILIKRIGNSKFNRCVSFFVIVFFLTCKLLDHRVHRPQCIERMNGILARASYASLGHESRFCVYAIDRHFFHISLLRTGAGAVVAVLTTLFASLDGFQSIQMQYARRRRKCYIAACIWCILIYTRRMTHAFNKINKIHSNCRMLTLCLADRLAFHFIKLNTSWRSHKRGAYLHTCCGCGRCCSSTTHAIHAFGSGAPCIAGQVLIRMSVWRALLYYIRRNWKEGGLGQNMT